MFFCGGEVCPPTGRLGCLFWGLRFESDVEIEGRLSILGTEGVMCFRVLGHLRVSGSMSFRNCHGPRGEVANYFAGGAIHSRNITISNAGSLRIQNCSSDNGGGVFALSVLMDSGNSFFRRKDDG